MRPLALEGSAYDIGQALEHLGTGWSMMPTVKRELLDYQMAALYYLAQAYDRPGALFLEIGTGRGGSGYMLAKAAPNARIDSLTVSLPEAMAARYLWKHEALTNIEAHVTPSWDYLQQNAPEMLLDLVFVDGDHNRITRDLPWFNRLAVGGLMLFHDYSPQDSARPSAICYAELNKLAERLGRPFDVRIVDDTKTGMVGFYRREGEVYGPR